MMSKLDLTRLTNIVRKAGKTVARCPACSARGGDATGNNLVVFADGRFGCVAYPKDKEHNKKILDLAGSKEAGAYVGSIPVNRVQHHPTEIIKIVGRLGRSSTTAQGAAVADKLQPPEPIVEPMAGAESKPGPGRPAEPFKMVVSVDVAADLVPESRPVLSFRELLEPMGFVLRDDGCFVDPKKLDSAGNPKVVARSGRSR